MLCCAAHEPFIDPHVGLLKIHIFWLLQVTPRSAWGQEGGGITTHLEPYLRPFCLLPSLFLAPIAGECLDLNGVQPGVVGMATLMTHLLNTTFKHARGLSVLASNLHDYMIILFWKVFRVRFVFGRAHEYGFPIIRVRLQKVSR